MKYGVIKVDVGDEMCNFYWVNVSHKEGSFIVEKNHLAHGWSTPLPLLKVWQSELIQELYCEA